MSDFLPPESLLTPSRQEILGTLVNAMRQPSTIALVASLGVHGLFLAGLPFLSSVQSKQPKQQETVQLLELTPAEQSRLPSSSFSQSFPSPMVPPRPTASPDTPATPNQTATVEDSPLYDFPMVPPPPVVNYPPELENPAPARREQVTFQDIPALKNPKPANNAGAEKSTAPAPADQDEAEPPAAPSAEDLKSDDLSRSGRPRLTAEEVFRLQQQAKQEQAAAQQQAYLQDMYGTFNAGAASLEAYQKNLESLTGNANDGPDRVDWQLPDDEEKQQLTEEMAKLYPTEACPFKLKATVVQVAAIVQPDGKLMGDKPHLVLSSGYKGLDKVALEYIAKKQFKPGEEVQFFLFKLPFPAAETVCPPVATDNKPAS